MSLANESESDWGKWGIRIILLETWYVYGLNLAWNKLVPAIYSFLIGVLEISRLYNYVQLWSNKTNAWIFKDYAI